MISSSGHGLRAAADRNWRRAYGRPLPLRGRSSWSVRIDRSRGNQGFLLLGVSLLMRSGVTEWSLSPFYGRLFRRQWDRDGELIMGAPPPEGYPDGHLKHMLIDEDGDPLALEGRAAGATIELTIDHDAGTLAFRYGGGFEGPVLEGFPHGDSRNMLLRPVVAFPCSSAVAGEGDQVTIRSAARLRAGWPQQDEVRERDARGLAAARALAAAVSTPSPNTCIHSTYSPSALISRH